MLEIKIDLDKTVRKGDLTVQVSKTTGAETLTVPRSIRENGFDQDAPGKPYVFHYDRDLKILIGMTEETEAQLRKDTFATDGASVQE